MDMKAFLMQNVSPVALLVFEIYVTKFSLEKGNKSLNSAICPQKMGLALKKLVLMSLPHVNSAISKQKKIFSFCTFLGPR